MNKSLRFLAIGLALAVLLVSQVGVDRSAVAHEDVATDDLVSLDQDEVMFVDHHGQEKVFYKFGDTMHFLLRDNDLAQDTSRFTETVTWVLDSASGDRPDFDLVTGAIDDDGPVNDPKIDVDGSANTSGSGTGGALVNTATTTKGTVEVTLEDDAGTVTFKGTDFPPEDNTDTPEIESDVLPGENAFAGGFQYRPVTDRDDATSTDDYIVIERGTDLTNETADPSPLAKPAALTPLVESPVVRVGYQIVDTTGGVETNVGGFVNQSRPLILGYSNDGGTFSLFDAVPATVSTADGCPALTEAQSAAGTTRECKSAVEAKFDYHIVDVFKANQNLGTGADDDQNRVLVTTSSSPSGKWVTIREVNRANLDLTNAIGTTEGAVVTTEPRPQSNYYYGSIKLVDDTQEGRINEKVEMGTRAQGNIYARDGDTITVQFFEKDHSTEIGSAEATADGLKPSIGGVEPAANSVLNEASPVLRFTLSDAGSGFDTGDFDSHVDLYLVSLRPDFDFGDADAVKAVRDDETGCHILDDTLSATSLNEDEMTVQFRSRRDWGDDEAIAPCTAGSTESRFLAQTAALRNNSHGDPFGVRIVVEDVAGNEQRSLTKLTIDGQAPLLVAAGSHTGRTWDVDEGKEVKATNAIRLKFSESLDKDTVGADDFTVENPDVTVEEVIVGGVNTEDEDDPNKSVYDKDEIVYLVLSEDLDSDDEPRVELDGSISDLAGNERKKQVITRLTDRIGPTLTVDPLSAQLLAKDGEATVSFGSDESLSAAGSSDVIDDCTCLSISGAGQKTDGSATTKGGTVNLPTPSTATYTFKQSDFKSTGIYGILVQGTDSGANETAVGATKVSNEEVTLEVADVTDDGVVVSLKNWPLADADFDGSLADEVKVSTTSGGDTVATSTVTSVDWKSGTVTMDLGTAVTKSKNEDDEDVLNRSTIYVTYSYVKAEQTVQVDDSAPKATFKPSADTQNASPFIEIQWAENEYAGDTHKTVTITSATLTGPNDFELVLVDDETDVLSTSDDILYTYLPDSDLALGEYTITAVGRDEAGNVSDPQTGKFKVVARAPVTITLNLGWNLMSLPAEAADSAIDAVINVDEVSQVLTYDPTVEGGWLSAVRVNGAFEGALTNIEASKAYLVYTTGVDPLKVDIPGLAQGTAEFPPTVKLYKGWNMVPSSSLDPAFPKRDIDSYLSGVSWSRGYYYDANGRLTGFIPGTGSDARSDDELVIKGRGFLIYVTEDSTLVP